MMLLKKMMLSFFLCASFSCMVQAQNSEKSIKAIAEKFVKAADEQDVNMLQEVMHPESLQFISMGPRLIKTPAEQYIAALAAKKIGGEPRALDFKTVEFLGKNTAIAVLHAKSSKFNFTYQLSIAKLEEKWMIIGIMTEVQKLKG